MIVGTAGHVDHGKSTLVRLLTGTDPDRWVEERRRGLTIGLGFAFSQLEDGTRLSMVDVPGHARFVRTMLTGAHAVDVALLAVAATEGWMPQTEEHVGVLELLGTPGGVIALTHLDRVAPARAAAVETDVRARVRGTFLSEAEIVGVDATTPVGLDRLRAAIGAALGSSPPHRGGITESGRPRMWIDRSAVLDGVGRVITGSLTGGEFAVGDRVQVVRGSEVAGATVRSLHVDGEPVAVAAPRRRVAMVLSGNDLHPRPGAAVVLPGQWSCGRHLHVTLEALGGRPAPVARGGHDLMIGTRRWPVQLRRPRTIEPASSRAGPRRGDLVRLHAAEPVGPVAPGDRLVLFDTGIARCVAGGIVLAVEDRVVRRRPDHLGARARAIERRSPQSLLDAILHEQGGVVGHEVARAAVGSVPATPRIVVHAGRLLDAEAVRTEQHALCSAVERADGSGLSADRDDPVRAAAIERLVAAGALAARDGRLWSSDGEADASRLATDDHLVSVAGRRVWRRDALAMAAGVGGRAVGDRVRSGLLVDLGGDRLVSAEALREWEREVRDELARAPATLARLRDLLRLSRREALLVMEALDAGGVTERIGDRRVLRG